MSLSRRKRNRPAGVIATVVGVLGEVLITLGVLCVLFVVWQLWWTDVVANRTQAQVVEDLGWVLSPDDPEIAVRTPDAVTGDTDAPPVMAEPAVGTTFATLRVPRWGGDYVRPISEGTSRAEVLDVLGIGHYEGTAMPGAIGNFSVAGHRTTYGKPFNRVEELVVGDALVVQTQDTWYIYRVTDTLIVYPHEVEVLDPVPGARGAVPTEAVMTMTTCHPMYSPQQRYVVHATLDHWMPTADGIPAEIDGGA